MDTHDSEHDGKRERLRATGAKKLPINRVLKAAKDAGRYLSLIDLPVRQIRAGDSKKWGKLLTNHIFEPRKLGNGSDNSIKNTTPSDHAFFYK